MTFRKARNADAISSWDRWMVVDTTSGRVVEGAASKEEAGIARERLQRHHDKVVGDDSVFEVIARDDPRVPY